MNKALFVLLIYLLMAVGALAQDGDALFAAALNAHGAGTVALVQTVTIRGRSTRDQAAEPVSLTASLDGKLRIDYGQPVARSEVSSLERSFTVQNGVTTWRPPHSGAYAQLDWFSILGVRHLANGIERTAAGPGTVSGRTTDRVRAVTGRDQTHYRRLVKDEAEVQFDRETGLVAAISRQQYADESLDLEFTLTTTFSDYRLVSGLYLPYELRRYLNGTLRETIIVESIEINSVFASDWFGS